MDEHCRGCIRYLRSCTGVPKAVCEKNNLRISRTNADRIRAMSDEELAEFLTTVAQNSANKLCENLKTVDVDLSNCDFDILHKTHLNWLKQPVDKNNEARKWK